MKSCFRPSNRTRGVAAALLALALLPGCYDAGELMQAQRAAHEAVSLEEVDLGEYRIVLPHAPGAEGIGKCDFHAFAHVSHGDRSAVQEAVATREGELHARMLVAVRSLSPRQFEEPRLDLLRQTIAQVLNDAAGGKLVQRVGFYKFSVAKN